MQSNRQFNQYSIMPNRIGLLPIVSLLIWLTLFLPATAEAKRLIRVGLFQNSPIIFQDKDRFPKGIYVDILNEVAQTEGWKLIYLPETWNNCLENLRNRKIDLMTSITYTHERDAYIDFSKENVLMMWGQVYVKKDKEIQNILDLQDSKVAVLKGGINALNFKNLVERFNVNCQLIPVDTQLKVLELTSSGKTDAGILNNFFGNEHEDEYDLKSTPILFNPFSLVFAVPEGMNSDLTTIIDSQIKLWKQDKDSVYYKILNKWHGTVTTQEDVIPTWLLFLLGTIGCTVIFLSVWMNILKKQVKARTRELVKSNIDLRNEMFERIQAEESFRASEEKLRLTTEKAGVAVWEHSITENTMNRSTNYDELYGLEQQDVHVAGNYLKATHPDDRKLVSRIIKDSIASDGPDYYSFDFRALWPDESVHWLAITGEVIERNDKGTANLIRGCLVDITERKRVEKALEENKLKVENLLSNLSGMIYRCKNEPRWTPDFVSEGSYSLTGYLPQDFTDSRKITYADLIHPQDHQMVWDTVQEQLKSKQTFELSYRIITANGEEKWVWEKGRAIYGANDEVIALESFINDITESKQMKEHLVLSETRYQTLFSNAPVPLWEEDFSDLYAYLEELKQGGVIDFRSYFEENPEELEICAKKVKVLNVNQETLKLHEARNKDDLLGNLEKIFTENSLDCFKEEVIALASGKSKFESETEIRTLLGKAKQIFITCTINKKQGDSIKGLLATIDITERKQIEKQLLQARKMESVGRLAGGVAHDYNNALSAIVGFTELAMDGLEEASPLHDDLKEVISAANRATSITRQLLAFASQQTIAPTVIDLNENLENMLKMLHRLIGENIELVWSPEANLRPIKFDPTQIDQILINLCVNARDSINDIGTITIETKNASFDDTYCANHEGFKAGEFITLTVSDNGCGMSKELLENIFEPFFTTKDTDKGTGLGLATVYGIVKQNEGFININSEPGQGTAISIYLPSHEVNIIEPGKDVVATSPKGHGETVLLVEDDLPILKLARKILTELGYTVLNAATPYEAMDLAKGHDKQIDLFVTDVIMPEMNGRDLTEALRPLYPDAKYLYMSGYTANIIAQHGVLDEQSNFIQKPFSKNALAQAVREALDG